MATIAGGCQRIVRRNEGTSTLLVDRCTQFFQRLGDHPRDRVLGRDR